MNGDEPDVTGVDRAVVRDALAGLTADLRPDLASRHESGDADAALELVVLSSMLAEEASAILADAVDGARHQKISWSRIGDSLGMSRQAAQQRFGTAASGTVPSAATDGQVWRLSPVTAFDEMDELERYGRQGWHSIGYGPLFHDMVRDGFQWEHRRSSVFGARRSRLEADGWQLIGASRFPWGYYARSTGRPAEPLD